MTQLPKYTWLIDTIRRAGKISHKELSDKWERNYELSDYKPLHRTTFNRWREAIAADLGIVIACQRKGGYLYYIENDEDDINKNQVQKWMLDSFALSNTISNHLSLKDRILVPSIPSGRDHLTTILNAMKENLAVVITHRAFGKATPHTTSIEPYCVKLFEARWYVLAHNTDYDDIRIYGLDRIEEVVTTADKFTLPEGFSAEEYFSNHYGIYIGNHQEQPERIVIRANEKHKNYMMSLPLHHSQKLIEDYGGYADFELYLVPTYDFVMRLLHVGALIEVLSPASLRREMKGWTRELYNLYKK